MRAIALAAGCLACALAAGHGVAAPDRVYAIGGSGWASERFGSGLAVLRARINTVSPREDASGALLLTCEGRERRLLLDLPRGDLARDGRDVGARIVPGRMLVRRPRASPEEAFTATVTIEDGRRATLADGVRDPEARGVMRFVRMLRRRPGRIDLLVSVGPTNLARDIPIQLVLAFGPQDAIVLDDVAATCDSDEPARTAPAR